MKVGMFHLMILFQGISETTTQGTAFVAGMAELRCKVNNTEQLDVDRISYHWQKETSTGPEAMFEKTHNKLVKENVHKKFLNRTMILNTNWDLYLYNITIEDEGKYSCHIILKRQKWDGIHRSTFVLKVIANFSTPEIVMFPKQVNTTDLLKLECSSKHGYPKPGRMDWIVSNSTGKYNIPHIPLIAQDEVSKMYNISSNISLLITENTKVTCELLSENNVISTVTEIGMDDLNPILPMKPSNDLIYISIVPAFLILIVGFIYLKWRMKKPTSVASSQSRMRHSALPAESNDENDYPRSPCTALQHTPLCDLNPQNSSIRGTNEHLRESEEPMVTGNS